MAAVNMNQEMFNRVVLEEKKIALVEFSAPWCGYCRRIAPAYAKFAEQYADKIVSAHINIDDDPDLAKDYQVELVPTFILYKDGQPVDRMVAPDSKAKIEAFVEKHL